MKKIFLFMMILFLSHTINAGEIVFGKVYISSFTLKELKDVRQKLIQHTKDHPQPAGRYRAVVNVSTNTCPDGVAFSNWNTEMKIDQKSEIALVSMDSGVLDLEIIQNLITKGKVKIITKYQYDKKGYINDENFFKMREAYKDFINKYRYEVHTTTK